jgi:hypothetical protein
LADTEHVNLEMTGNSHHANASNKVTNKIPEEVEEATTEVAKTVHSSARKEKSVLQSKLTKLAIQIGYGGKNYLIFLLLLT